MKTYYVYILANKRNGILYVGLTNNIERRTWQHKNEFYLGFTQKYGVHKLVYFEVHQNIWEAVRREKILKKWKRAWKIALIEKDNKLWKDLSCRWRFNAFVNL